MYFVDIAVAIVSVGFGSTHFDFCPVYSPIRVFTQNKGSLYLLLFFLHLLLVGAYVFDSVDKLLQVSNMASSGLKKMLDLLILYTLKSVSENVYLVILFFDTKINIMSYKHFWYTFNCI